ncbi:TIGR03032 family protein [Solemya velum gill symbiont]|uniref:TIGR03032 family protein n=1 Tax=Solemya velum gill symbiont TaxID=2340 RepID=UPI00117A509F|nr:TIGR03032 family protein [Solemya velum gill symbiont]
MAEEIKEGVAEETGAESEYQQVKQPADAKAQAADENAKQQQEPVKYSMSGGFADFLLSHKISVAMTSYQSGRLYLLGRNPKGGLMVNEQFFKRAMGLHVHEKSLYMAGVGHIFRMENILQEGQWINETFTQCFVPRTDYFIGSLDAHDVGLAADGRILFINTKYNCLASVSDVHSFKEEWRPPFISKLVPEDRCHLNGLAMENGEARYVTAVCKSDTIDGWRDRRADGGIVMDLATNETVCEGLSMPHSPRLYNGKLWVLNSGTGELGSVNLERKSFEPLAFCPGFVRGLAFHSHFAFVGLSRPRYDRFEGLDLDRRLKEADSEPWTGVQVIDLNTGAVVHWFRIDGPVAEMYDVAVMPDVICAKSVGPGTAEALALITIEPEPETA